MSFGQSSCLLLLLFLLKPLHHHLCFSNDLDTKLSRLRCKTFTFKNLNRQNSSVNDSYGKASKTLRGWMDRFLFQSFETTEYHPTLFFVSLKVK